MLILCYSLHNDEAGQTLGFDLAKLTGIFLICKDTRAVPLKAICPASSLLQGQIVGEGTAFSCFKNMARNWIVIDYDKNALAWIEMTTGGGCYAIYCDKRLVYIGQAGNVRKRISSYRIQYGYSSSIYTPWGTCLNVVIKISKSRRYGDWAMKELRLIRRLKPVFNCVGGSRRRGAVIDLNARVLAQIENV
jgi:hypothetical protein